MKRVLEVALGIVTSIGGFLEVGSIATSAQAGAQFGFALLWVIALGTLCLIFLVEMSGRLAALSQHTIADALRERFGFNVFFVILVTVGTSSLLVLGSEIAGICMAVQLATGIAFSWWALPMGVLVWLLLWKGTFSVIEYGVCLLGLVTVVFLVAAFRLQPPVRDIGAGLLPTLPGHDAARYGFLAVNILGATLTPYLFYFYSSGAIEDRWGRNELGLNRVVASLGMAFGGVLSMAVLVVAALVFHPRGILIDQYEQLGVSLTDPLGWWGFWLFVAALGIACLGAALEIALALAYLVAQGFGWKWGENVKPRKASRFAAAYTVCVLLAMVLAATGVDPLKLTNLSMTLTSLVLPLAVGPFLLLMNDRRYVGEHGNGWLGNAVVAGVTALTFVLALASIPLEIFGG